MRIAVIAGSTRPKRRARMVADWVTEVARRHIAGSEVRVDLVDLADVDLPLLDEPVAAAHGLYEHEHTRRWAETIRSYEGFVIVTPEYNHSVPAALKNAIDYLYAEWSNKAVGFVGYGLNGGVRAIEHLRLIVAELEMADVRSHVLLSLFGDFELADTIEPGVLKPGDHQEATLTRLVDEVVAWSGALRPLREQN
ncbi:NAD(P)H-dependent oxidoreductase [Ornithinimicrobium sufpigmenti]|uniref:NADPH-dependent FMN reductase n=1 Tax=Ornithinimicrobium sufpigmenti TaxID=2508882 RepID=UPI00307C7162